MSATPEDARKAAKVQCDYARFTKPIDECIANQMKQSRFPVPTDKAQKPTSASFSVTIQLTPDK